eukprot:15205693-Alexandrium_andersonii.AAC.1
MHFHLPACQVSGASLSSFLGAPVLGFGSGRFRGDSPVVRARVKDLIGVAVLAAPDLAATAADSSH